MNEQLKVIGERIKELRQILDISLESLAKKINIELAELEKYENGQADIPIGVLYAIAAELKTDATVLLTGENPKMSNYTIVRNGKGIIIERYKGYTFSSLAFNYVNRQMEPMEVTLSKNDHTPELVCHNGQEFNYVLEGEVEITIGEHKFVLSAGDSIYFNPKVPHSQKAHTQNAKFLTVINE